MRGGMRFGWVFAVMVSLSFQQSASAAVQPAMDSSSPKLASQFVVAVIENQCAVYEPAHSIVPVSPDFPNRATKAMRRNPEFLAHMQRVGAHVFITAIIRSDGRVYNIKVQHCTVPGFSFEKAAVRALKKTRYVPARRNCAPVYDRLELKVHYKVNETPKEIFAALVPPNNHQ